MSLYNDIANALSRQGLGTAIGGGVDAATGPMKNTGSTFGNAVGGAVSGMARNAATGVANKYIPGNMQRIANAATGAVGDIMNGNIDNAATRIFDSGVLDGVIPGMSGIAAQARYWGTPTPLYGGISPREAKQIYDELRNNRYARKNLYLLEVSSKLASLPGDVSGRFNMFAVDLDYAPYTITGEKKKIGAAHVDITNSADPVELRMTTMDDQDGFIKQWFAAHCAAAAAQDGTVGVPDKYAISIRIVHGFITEGSNQGGYEDVGDFRPANMDISLSRRDQALSELQLTFVQLDTFMG